MVSPHSMVPLSGVSSPASSWRSVVLATVLGPMRAILSFLLRVKLMSFRTVSPSILWVRFLRLRMVLPQERLGLKLIYGARLEEVGSSSGRNFSMSFFREVACFDLEALALKRLIKSSSSLMRSVFFLLWSCFCDCASWLDSCQKS